MKGSKVYVLAVWVVSNVDVKAKEVLVFAEEQSTKDYIGKHLCLYWYEDEYGDIIKEKYTLTETKVL